MLLRRLFHVIGWTFAPPTWEAMLEAVASALSVYRKRPQLWRQVHLRGMVRDCGWDRAARQWQEVLLTAAADRARAWALQPWVLPPSQLLVAQGGCRVDMLRFTYYRMLSSGQKLSGACLARMG